MRHNKCLNVENGVPSNASHLADQRTPAKTRREAAKGQYLPLTEQDLVKAEFAILKFVQSSAFSEKNPCFGTIGNWEESSWK